MKEPLTEKEVLAASPALCSRSTTRRNTWNMLLLPKPDVSIMVHAYLIDDDGNETHTDDPACDGWSLWFKRNDRDYDLPTVDSVDRMADARFETQRDALWWADELSAYTGFEVVIY